MQLFYASRIDGQLAFFDEEESRHLHTVLRHKPGDLIRLTDGQGFFYDAELSEVGKKQVVALVKEREPEAASLRSALHVAIAPTKHIDRFEWFLEKATEIGVATVTPLLCARSERRQIRHDRLEKILVSAMKQSLRATLPRLMPLTPFEHLVTAATESRRCLAWVDEQPRPHLSELVLPGEDLLVLIGPEGDFSHGEIQRALQHEFQPVQLGPARLRTETAGLYAVATVAIGNAR